MAVRVDRPVSRRLLPPSSAAPESPLSCFRRGRAGTASSRASTAARRHPIFMLRSSNTNCQ
ncbi:hypothetical protein C7S13_5241 [Burkholderia cepacia]|nr:hypothetical protein [Burkholderia cepacia]